MEKKTNIAVACAIAFGIGSFAILFLFIALALPFVETIALNTIGHFSTLVKTCVVVAFIILISCPKKKAVNK